MCLLPSVQSVSALFSALMMQWCRTFTYIVTAVSDYNLNFMAYMHSTMACSSPKISDIYTQTTV